MLHGVVVRGPDFLAPCLLDVLNRPLRCGCCLVTLRGPGHQPDAAIGRISSARKLICGILGGIGAELDNLLFMKRTADRLFGDQYFWSVLAGGRHQMNFCTNAAMMGGNVRVGLEDSLYIGPGKLAKSNAEQVAKIRHIVEELGFEIATPAEARALLGLKGGDRVKF